MRPQLRRLRTLRVSDDLLMGWFLRERPEVARIDHRLPEDCRIVGARMDPFRPRTVEFLLESEAFDPVPEGEGVIPEVDPLRVFTSLPG